MDKLSEIFKNFSEKWKNFSKTKKVSIVVLSTSLIVVILALGINLNKTKYGVLFSGMDPKDSGAVVDILKEKKVNYKVDGNSILVPEEQISPLKMELLSKVDFTNGSKGFEIFDNSSMVSTDFENEIKYQKALQGELERMIKSFDEVKDCKVILKLPEKNQFALKDNSTTASAAVSIKLQSGIKELNEGQVKAIVSLLTGGVENLPKENVNIAVNNMNLVTEGIFESKAENGMVSTNKQSQIRATRENELKNNILEILRPIYGEGVNVAVNVDMNFDAVQTESKDYKNGVVVSEHNVDEKNQNNSGNVSSSPVDNNLTNRVDNGGNNTANSQRTDVTKNYNVPEVKKTQIDAPGKVQKVSVSVAVDEANGRLDDGTKEKIKSTVATAVGYNEKRGDSISVEGFNYDTAKKDLINKANKELQDAEKLDKRKKLQRDIAIAVGAVMTLLILLLVYRRKHKEDKVYEEEGYTSSGIDELIGDDLIPKEPEITFEPINFEREDQNSHVEKEVKKYALDKPDQVAEIIKSWLAEDER